MRQRHIAPVALVLVLSVAGFIIARALAERGARRDAEHRAEVAAAQVGDRVRQAVSLTESLRRFMVDAGGTGVTSAQFSRNAFGWLSPAGFPAAAWVEHVPASRRAGYERRTGQPIVSPDAQHGVLPARARASYLPATLVSGFPPMSDAGIDLGGEPGIDAARARATRLNGVAATAPDGALAGTRGLFLVAPAPNLIDEVLRPGYVVLFVPDATLRAAAGTPGVQLAVGRSTTPNLRGGGTTFRTTFSQAGQRFDVAVPQRSVQEGAAALPWIILGTGLVLAACAAALGVFAGRRARAQDELDRIFHLSSDLIAVADLEGHFTRVNPAFERTLGYSSEELRSRPYVEFVHPEDRPRTLQAAAELAQGRDVIEFENRYLRKDGSVRWLEWSARSAPGEAVIYAAARDVTERKELEAEQAALRRVATAVARGGSSDDIFAATVDELHAVVAADFTALMRYEADDFGVLLATLGESVFEVGARIALTGENATAEVRRTGRAARVDYERASGPVVERMRAGGFSSGVAAPIFVEGRLWGVMACGWTGGPPPRDAEARVAQFTDLVGTAIANAEGRAELLASRSRIVTTADQTRRRIERDLHDGAQQRLVTLTMKLRALNGSADVSEIAAGLDDVLDDLRETARGLHPVMLTRGGLGPALKALGRRSPVPVELDVRTRARLPEPVEVAAYYVVTEALTNAAKHAHASLVTIEADLVDSHLRLLVQDDGVGGANPGRGSGLVGLIDRVEALGGKLTLHSPPAGGTTLRIDLPLAD